jgi:hypothetical protein
MSKKHPFIAMFMNLGEGDRETSARRDAFLEGVNTSVAGAGPVPGLTVALRFGNADFINYPQLADELHKLTIDGAGPDLYFTTCWPSLKELWKIDAPVVFAGIPEMGPAVYQDNAYGFLSSGKNICREWLDLLHKVDPDVERVGLVFDNDLTRADAQNIYQEVKLQAPSFGMTVSDIYSKINCGSGTLQLDIKRFKDSDTTKAGLVVAMSALTARRRTDILAAAQLLDLPTIYPNRLYTVHGGDAKCAGLASRGTYLPDNYYNAGGYARMLIDYYVRGVAGAKLPSPKSPTQNFVKDCRAFAA